ncbi:MAG: acyl-ACP--UDP-N-acetylglucosamine O-acyltransferase [Chitinophagaceae bacterium]|nr:acyl-ACP--UDP-N-acetylglucosamine O-acyltransferase [Chitinophagaceae bacterium]
MISPLAYIHPDAKIGKEVTIEPFAVIHDKVTIGDHSHIMSHAVIHPYARIGEHCQIFPGAVISAIPQDLKFIGEETFVEIGDHTIIRECVTVNRGTQDRWKTILGKHCLLMAYSHVAHDCILGDNVILGNAVQLAGHVTIDDYAILSGMAGAHQFTHIGAHTYIAGHTVIRKDVPPFIKAAREPLSYMGINIVGLQRRNFSKEAIAEISNIYHILFVERNTTTIAVQHISDTLPASEIKDQILQFIAQSKSGIIKRPSKTASDADFTF